MKSKVIYDSECSFCVYIKHKLEYLDFNNNFEWIKAKEYIADPKKISEVSSELINKTIVLIKTDNQLLIEFKACRYIMSKIIFFYPIIFFLYIPFLSNFLGNIIYRYVSKMRKCNI